MASQLASLEEDRQQYQEQVDSVLAGLKDDPGNVELKTLQAELNEMISMLDESIAELRPKQAPKPAAPQKSPTPPEPEKWSRENHPAFKQNNTSAAPATAAPPADDKDESAPASYTVNDTVLAKWISGDKSFYPARITSITGSSTAPVYIVKFKTYDNTETLRAKDIRPVSNKRKADGTPASSNGASPYTSQPTPPSSTTPLTQHGGNGSNNDGIVTSASASIYPEQQAKLEAEKKAADDAEAKPRKPKKIKATKELEKGKSKWQEFSAKSKYGKSHKKDSMFRTPDGVGGRVGFTGSGQTMRKDPTRSRHIYQQNEDLD